MSIHFIINIILTLVLAICFYYIIRLDNENETLETVIDQKQRQITMLNQRMKDLVGKIK